MAAKERLNSGVLPLSHAKGGRELASYVQGRLQHDSEPYVMDSASNGKAYMNFRIQRPTRTLRALNFDSLELFQLMIEDQVLPSLAPHLNRYIEPQMSKQQAAALYDALSRYYTTRFKQNPVQLFSGKVMKGRVKMEVYWLRVGKIFMLPAYNMFNNGLNFHLYISPNAMRGFPADTARSQYMYDAKEHAKLHRGVMLHAGAAANVTDVKGYARALQHQLEREKTEPRRKKKAA